MTHLHAEDSRGRASDDRNRNGRPLAATFIKRTCTGEDTLAPGPSGSHKRTMRHEPLNLQASGKKDDEDVEKSLCAMDHIL